MTTTEVDLKWAIDEDTILHILDRIAYRMPALADVLVSVWRPAEAARA